MNEFYIKLKNALETAEGDIWSETVLTGDLAGRKSLYCGSGMPDAQTSERIYRERIGRSPKMVICGAGHVSVPVIQMGKMLGFTVTVVEDRPKFAENARRAGADIVICEPFESGLKKIHGDSDTWFVIVTRGHRYDMNCLRTILGKQYAYVGMMGSRRRVAIVKEQLESSGISREVLDQVHTPIGLKIGAETPAEIAVAVMAEIIQEKNMVRDDKGQYSAKKRTGIYSSELLSAIYKEDDVREKVLATIISRKGSAPRSVGTRMLIFEDGSTVDTIGGGCIESEIIQKARLMMHKEKGGFELCHVDMTASVAEEEGMVCGGIVEVMLEKI